MTVMRGQETTLQTDSPQVGRTFAMNLFAAGNGVTSAVLAYVLITIALPATDDPELAAAIPVFIAIAAIVGVIGVLAVVWSGARRQPWFWLVAALPGLLVLARKIPEIAYDISRPANTEFFLLGIFALIGGVAIIFGGITAFLEARRSRVSWTHSGRAGWVAMAVIGTAVGAASTSILAGLAPAGGVEFTDEPTMTGMLTAQKTAFVDTRFQMKDGEVLGLFVTNRDDIAHSFDIDSLDIHVDLPANSTTSVAIKPTDPGTLEFFCAVPGHREAGMVGTIEVEA